MYAVFQSGGKQHRVSEGQTIRLEKLEVATGETIEFDTVMMVADGDNIQMALQSLRALKLKRKWLLTVAAKVKIVKFRRRKHSRKQQATVSGLLMLKSLVSLKVWESRLMAHKRLAARLVTVAIPKQNVWV